MIKIKQKMIKISNRKFKLIDKHRDKQTETHLSIVQTAISISSVSDCPPSSPWKDFTPINMSSQTFLRYSAFSSAKATNGTMKKIVPLEYVAILLNINISDTKVFPPDVGAE